MNELSVMLSFQISPKPTAELVDYIGQQVECAVRRFQSEGIITPDDDETTEIEFVGVKAIDTQSHD